MQSVKKSYSFVYVFHSLFGERQKKGGQNALLKCLFLFNIASKITFRKAIIWQKKLLQKLFSLKKDLCKS